MRRVAKVAILLAALVPACWLLHELGEFVLRPLVG